ncbi:MAG: sigma factor [Planctomycetaceae bacterium]
MNEHTRSVMRQWTLAQPVVSAFITSIVRDFTDRDDVLQNTAVAVLESCSRYDSDRPFLAWALGVAQNQIRLIQILSSFSRSAAHVYICYSARCEHRHIQ